MKTELKSDAKTNQVQGLLRKLKVSEFVDDLVRRKVCLGSSSRVFVGSILFNFNVIIIIIIIVIIIIFKRMNSSCLYLDLIKKTNDVKSESSRFQIALLTWSAGEELRRRINESF